MEHRLPPSACDALTIEHWRQCLLKVAAVTMVTPVANADGTSRKSAVDEETIAAGKGHFCPYELYCFIGGRSKAHRVTTGLSTHRGFLHTYCRTPPQQLDKKLVAAVFKEACGYLDAQAAHAEDEVNLARPPPPRRAPPKPMYAVVLSDFNGPDFGAEYLKLSKGDRIVPLKQPSGVDPVGWAYGCLIGTCLEGWYPPSYISPCHYELH